MKTIYSVIFSIFIFNLTVFAQSPNKEEIAKKTINSSVILAKNMKAYQIKSENKIQEFYSYLNILGKPEVKPELKQHTILEIKKLFKEANTEIPNFLKEANKDIVLNDFLNLVAKSGETCTFSIENISESYVQTNNKNQHWWTIAYTLHLVKGKTKYTFRDIMQNVILLQEEKQFGTNSKLVWNSYLTNLWLK